MTADRGHHPQDGDRERLLSALFDLVHESYRLAFNAKTGMTFWTPVAPSKMTVVCARDLLDEIQMRAANDCRAHTAEDEWEGVHTWLCVCGLTVARVGGVLLDQFAPPHTHRCARRGDP